MGKSNPNELFKIDEIDQNILTLLQQDGTRSLRDRSRELNISVSTAKSHYDRLIENGIIKKIMALVDCSKIGYREMLIFNVRTSVSEPIANILENLSKIEKIKFLYHISGTYPILGMAKCLGRDGQIALLEQIKQVRGVEEVIPQVVLQKVKEDPTIIIPES